MSLVLTNPQFNQPTITQHGFHASKPQYKEIKITQLMYLLLPIV